MYGQLIFAVFVVFGIAAIMVLAPLTKTQYRKRWEKYCKSIGHQLTAHQLRHGFATILYEAGIPDKDAQELLGHSSITVTRDVYTHIRNSRRTDTAAKLEAFISGQS